MLRRFTIRYTRDHHWVDMDTGYCGITRFIYDDLMPIKSQYVPIKTQPRHININHLVGVLSVETVYDRYNIILPSIAAGYMSKVNLNWDTTALDANWLYQIPDIEEFSRDIMEYDDYMAYLQSMH